MGYNRMFVLGVDPKDANWDRICSEYELPKTFMRKYYKYLNWKLVCKHQTLTERFMREFIDLIDWRAIARYQYLSEWFMEDFAENLNWNLLSVFQLMSDEFIKRNEHRIMFKRPSIRFNRDIGKANEEDRDNYFKKWSYDQEVTWNQIIKRFPKRKDYILSLVKRLPPSMIS